MWEKQQKLLWREWAATMLPNVCRLPRCWHQKWSSWNNQNHSNKVVMVMKHSKQFIFVEFFKADFLGHNIIFVHNRVNWFGWRLAMISAFLCWSGVKQSLIHQFGWWYIEIKNYYLFDCKYLSVVLFCQILLHWKVHKKVLHWFLVQ